MSKAPWVKNAALFIFVIYWCTSVASGFGAYRRLSRMQTFYEHALGIRDQDIQTISWVRVVDGLVKLHNANVATADQGPAVRKYTGYSKPQQRMNAETIANRLMRQANYYVAMYNKEILDFTLPLPFVGHRQFYSKSLEWGIDFCLTNFIFDEQGSIRPFCLDVRNRKVLVQALQVRLQFAALTSIFVAPFNILRFCIVYFFRYYTEFTRNPSKASTRSFTPFAEWKMREFNELDHLFARRLKQALQPAN
ncbi:autophagy protein atg9, partial [Teratosphaeriaceae sp. CCFEE 6253]